MAFDVAQLGNPAQTDLDHPLVDPGHQTVALGCAEEMVGLDDAAVLLLDPQQQLTDLGQPGLPEADDPLCVQVCPASGKRALDALDHGRA